MSDIDPTWEAVMRRNSNSARVQPKQQQRHFTEDRDPTVYVKIGQDACHRTLANHRSIFQDQCNDSSWMDFLQILVHQHAKTIVHLQELSTEVEKLKDFRSSFISSLTADLVKSSSAGPSDLHHHLSQSKDVWTSSPNKLIDSGFSTETKESANQKEEEDPLYSLLDLIQIKVSNSANSTNSTHIATSSSNTAPAATCSCLIRLNNGTRQSANKLGKLDLVLGFKSGVGENVHIPRDVIRAILRELDVVELQRQLLFAAANVKTLESQLSSLELEENSSRLASKYLALSHENELLRFKLKEQEIQLEGTKARLRILEKKSQALDICSPKLSLIPLDSLPRSTNASSDTLHLSKSSSHSRLLDVKPLLRSSESYSKLPSDSSNTNEEKKLEFGQQSNRLLRATSTIPLTLSVVEAPLLKNTVEEMIVNSTTEVIDREALCGIGGDLENHGIISNQYSESEEQRLVVRSATSRIPTRVVVVNNSSVSACAAPVSTVQHLPHQSICCKSPGSSMSSKSSIPIAVTRIKRNGSIGATANVGSSSGSAASKVGAETKKPNSKFWTTWFAA